MLAVRECKSGAEVMENVRRTRAYFTSLRPVDSERVIALTSELGAVKAERDQYRALCGELRDKIRGYETVRLEALAAPASIEKIKFVLAEHYKITPQELCSYSRHPEVLLARQVAMYLCRKLTKNSMLGIARAFGKRDHTTVWHAERLIEEQRGQNPELNSLIQSVTEKIEQPIHTGCE